VLLTIHLLYLYSVRERFVGDGQNLVFVANLMMDVASTEIVGQARMVNIRLWGASRRAFGGI
jgi:hypothetical protein